MLIEQVEFANVIVINKTDLIDNQSMVRVENALKNLNPGAIVYKSTYSKIDLKLILNTNLFDFDKASQNPGWKAQLRGQVNNSRDFVKYCSTHRNQRSMEFDHLSIELEDPFIQSACMICCQSLKLIWLVSFDQRDLHGTSQVYFLFNCIKGWLPETNFVLNGKVLETFTHLMDGNFKAESSYT